MRSFAGFWQGPACHGRLARPGDSPRGGTTLPHLVSVALIVSIVVAATAGVARAVDFNRTSPQSERSPGNGLAPESALLADAWLAGPVETAVLRDAEDGRLDQYDLADAVLIVEGLHDRAARQPYRTRLEALTAGFGCIAADGRQADVTARRLLEYLHHEALTGGYDPRADELKQALDTGRYNCLSATLLFHTLATSLALEVKAVVSPGHLHSEVAAADGWLKVETTSPIGIGARQESPEASRNLAGGGTTPQTSTRRLRESGLLSLAYYNRGVRALWRGAYAEAVAANTKALRLDPANTLAKDNLFAAYNNWAVELSRSGKHSDAAALMWRGRRLAPSLQFFRKNWAAILKSRPIGDADPITSVDRRDEPIGRPVVEIRSVRGMGDGSQ